MRLLIILIFTLLTFNCFAQMQNFRKVNFEYQHSRRIPYNKVSVQIKSLRGKVNAKIVSVPSKDSKQWDYSRIDTIIEISEKSFLRMKDSILKIDAHSFFNGKEYIYTDGFRCSISFGDISDDIRYNIKSPTSRTKERKLETFLNSCILILKTVGLDPEDILYPKPSKR